MASTITLQQVVQWAQTQTELIPIIGVGGYGEEPALSICNDVMQEIMSQPFNWPFNSVQAPSFTTSVLSNQQDYPNTITDSAWVESCTMLDTLSTQQPQPVEIVEVVKNIQPSSQIWNPTKIAFMYPDDDGGIWRMWPVPSMGKQWTIMPVYQRVVPIKDSLSDTWFPLPDQMGFVIRQGFLAMAKKYAKHPDWQDEYKIFLSKIQKALGVNDMENNADGFIPDFGLFIG